MMSSKRSRTTVASARTAATARATSCVVDQDEHHRDRRTLGLALPPLALPRRSLSKERVRKRTPRQPRPPTTWTPRPNHRKMWAGELGAHQIQVAMIRSSRLAHGSILPGHRQAGMHGFNRRSIRLAEKSYGWCWYWFVVKEKHSFIAEN